MPTPTSDTTPQGIRESRLKAAKGELKKAHQLGFLGPQPVEQQLAHAVAFIDFLAEILASNLPGGPLGGPLGHAKSETLVDDAPQAAIDLGTGGGVPGFVGAALLPQYHWFFAERSATRARFLRLASSRLGWEDIGGTIERDVAQVRPDHDALTGYRVTVVTARSFGPANEVLKHADRLLVVGGLVIVSDPPEGGNRWTQLLAPHPQLRVVAQQTDPVSISAIQKSAQIA